MKWVLASGDTLWRDDFQLTGMSLIVLARQAQKISINWIYSADIGSAQEQHKEGVLTHI